MIRLLVPGIVFILGINVLLAIRDSRMWDKIDNRNNQIEQLLNS